MRAPTVPVKRRQRVHGRCSCTCSRRRSQSTALKGNAGNGMACRTFPSCCESGVPTKKLREWSCANAEALKEMLDWPLPRGSMACIFVFKWCGFQGALKKKTNWSLPKWTPKWRTSMESPINHSSKSGVHADRLTAQVALLPGPACAAQRMQVVCSLHTHVLHQNGNLT